MPETPSARRDRRGNAVVTPISTATAPPTGPDFDQAANFLKLLDETAERWTFQTFDDNKARKDPALARVLHGTLAEHWQALCELSSRGAGVFITVNETNGKGRKVADIIRVRAVFQECDRPGTPEPPLQPHIMVESSPGKYHRYLLAEGGHRFDLFEQVMARLIADFGSDPNAKDRARVLRLPGFPHQKDPAKPWMVRLIHESGEQPYTWDAITAAIPPLVIEKTAAAIPPGRGIDNPAKVRSALDKLSPDMEYLPWLQVGMALHHATAGGVEGLAIWDEWSARGNSYREGGTAQKWRSFGGYNGTPVTLASVFKLAVAAGWHWQGPADESLRIVKSTPRQGAQTPRRDFPQQPDVEIVMSNTQFDPNSAEPPEQPPPYGKPKAGKAAPAATPADAWPEPQPLPDGLPPVEPFAPELLPEVFRPWIEDIADRMQCPIDYPAIGVMVALAGVVGKQIGIRPKRKDDWMVIPNLWGGAVGRPGVMKTPALAEPMKPAQRLEISARDKYEADEVEFKVGKLITEERKKIAGGQIRKALKDGGNVLQIARDVIKDDAEEPTRRRFIVNDPTVEKLGELLNQNPNGLLLFRDELTGFLRTLDREGHEASRAFYLKAWNGDSRYVYDRIGRGTIEIEHACLSILGGIQPGPLTDYLCTAPDDGLMQRFQLLVWPDIAGDWEDIDRLPNSKAKETAYAVFIRLANLDLSAVEATKDAGPIPYLRFTDDAQELFSEWRNELETRLRRDNFPATLESHFAKYRSLIPSLALLIHLAEGNPGPVKLSALEQACAWGEYLESHAKRIYAPAIAPNQISARALAKRLLASDLPDRFTLRDVYRNHWSCIADQESALKAVTILIDFDWLLPETEQTGGRPRIWYVVNPGVKECAL